jgi:hypothetical protein
MVVIGTFFLMTRLTLKEEPRQWNCPLSLNYTKSRKNLTCVTFSD